MPVQKHPNRHQGGPGANGNYFISVILCTWL